MSTDINTVSNEGFWSFIKKQLGIKEAPRARNQIVHYDDEKLIDEIFRMVLKGGDDLIKSAKPVPYKPFIANKQSPRVRDHYNMHVTGDIEHVVKQCVVMNNWLNASAHITQAKQYADQVNKGVKVLKETYKANKSMDSEELHWLLWEKGVELAKGIKEPRFGSLSGVAPSDWWLGKSSARKRKPFTEEVPDTTKVIAAVRTLYNNYTPYSKLEKLWRGATEAGAWSGEDFWLEDEWELSDTNMGEHFSHESKPRDNLECISEIMGSYAETIENVLEFSIKYFDLKIESQ